MKKDEILAFLQKMAQSQGSYGRLLHYLETNNCLDQALEILEQQNYESPIELILALEN